eukprot:9206462-Lingulodinium_polyedra.AAC.1
MFTAIDAKEKDGTLAFADLTLFHTFSFLLNEGQAEKVKKLSEKLLAEVQASSRRKSASSAAGASSKASGSSKAASSKACGSKDSQAMAEQD